MTNLTHVEYISEDTKKTISDINGKKAGEVKVILSLINAQHRAETDIDFIHIKHNKKNNKIEVSVFDYSNSLETLYSEGTKEFQNVLNMFKDYGADTDKIMSDLNSLPKVPKNKTIFRKF